MLKFIIIRQLIDFMVKIVCDIFFEKIEDFDKKFESEYIFDI